MSVALGAYLCVGLLLAVVNTVLLVKQLDKRGNEWLKIQVEFSPHALPMFAILFIAAWPVVLYGFWKYTEETDEEDE